MENETLEAGAPFKIDGEPWHVHVDLAGQRWLTLTTSKMVAEHALACWKHRPGSTDGMSFQETSTGDTWHFVWDEIRNVRIMPLREAI